MVNYPSTLTFADLYGGVAPGRSRGETTEKDSASASGDIPGGDMKKPALYWVALVAMLVAVRVLAEKK